MKKLVLFSASIAALIAFSSCSKESESPASFNPGEKVTITFSTGKSIETKSAIAEEGATQATYEWTNEDAYNFKLYLVDGGNLTEVTEKTVTITSGTELSVTATVNAAASYTFRAIIAGHEVAHPAGHLHLIELLVVLTGVKGIRSLGGKGVVGHFLKPVGKIRPACDLYHALK